MRTLPDCHDQRMPSRTSFVLNTGVIHEIKIWCVLLPLFEGTKISLEIWKNQDMTIKVGACETFSNMISKS
jgi:hypothetical protein